MDLDKYLYENGRKSIRLSEQVQCTKQTISNIKTKKFTPNLLTALKLIILSGCQISLEELLKKEDREIFEDWMNKNNLTHYSNHRIFIVPKKTTSNSL